MTGGPAVSVVIGKGRFFASDSLVRRDANAARLHLAALHERRGGWLLGLTARLPPAAMALYRVRQAVRSIA